MGREDKFSTLPVLCFHKFSRLNWLAKESVMRRKQLFTAGSRKGSVQVRLCLCSHRKPL